MDEKSGANALGNAVAYLQITNYELRIIDNVRIAQIYGLLTDTESS